MNRRDFLRNVTIATAGLSAANLYGYAGIVNLGSGPELIAKRSSGLTIIAETDVLVVGASAAGIAAAVTASQNGARVFVVASEPYLGYDICATLRLWDLQKGTRSDFSESLLMEGSVPYPAHVKRTLQKHLIENNVDFLLSTFAGGIVLDTNNEISGIVLANRAGEQIIRAKTIIDATDNALVARMAESNFRRPGRNVSQYTFTVIGNKPVTALKHQSLSAVKVKDIEYPATVYRFSPDRNITDYAASQAFEQSVRDQTWDADQVDASDLLFEIPAQNIDSGNRSPHSFENAENLSLNALTTPGNNNLWLLNGYADVQFSNKEQMLLPANMIALGKRLGRHMASVAKTRSLQPLAKLKGRTGTMIPAAEGKVYQRKQRPAHQLGKFELESENIPVLGHFDNVIVGGGTAGACAAISSARYGANTVVVEYLHGLGGIGTLGLIGRYWVGYRDGFTKEIDEGVRNMAPADHPRQKNRPADWVKDWKMEYYRQEIQKAGGKVWFGAVACGAVVEGDTIKGVIVATPYGKAAIMAKNTIDSTGSADIAIAAGAQYDFIDADSAALQGSGLPKVDPNDHYNNTDYTFTDDTDPVDVTRTMVAGNMKFGKAYDIGKLPQTRERRRMIGDYTVSAMDMTNGRFYDDTISYHYSSFDTHGYTIDPYFIIKPPAGSTVDMYVNVPLRALLPKGLNNIIVTGLGASADRDAMPVIRMQPCLQNQGYSVGYLAALSAREGVSFREVDFATVRNELIAKKTLPEKTATGKDLFPPSENQIREASKAITNDFDQLEVILWDRERGLKILNEEFKHTSDQQLKARAAAVLGFYGYANVSEVLIDEISRYREWDKGWNFRGMHQFGMSASYLDALVMSLGKTRDVNGISEISRLAGKLTAESELSHFRAIAEAFADIGSADAIPVLYRLLNMPGVGGYSVRNFRETIFFTKEDTNDNSTRNNSLKELFLARALLICGDHNVLGQDVLTHYANDLHGAYSCHAMGVLEKYGKS